MAFLESVAPLADVLLSLPPELVPDAKAYQAVLDWKNLLFRTLVTERAHVETASNPQVAALLQEHTAVRGQLAAASMSVPKAPELQQYRMRVTSLTQRLEALEGELSRVSTAFRRAQAETTAGPPEVCATLPWDAALIDLFWYGQDARLAAPGASRTWTPHYVAFILRGGACADPIRVELGPAASIDEDIWRFREAISREAGDPAERELRARYRKALAVRLKAKLFPPEVQAAIEGRPRLVISPDSALALLPFALLPGEGGHEFLLESRTISYVPSGRDLLRAKERPSAAPTLLAVGAPAFDRVPLQVVQTATVRAGCGAQDDPFVPLPGTAAELEAIAKMYQQVRPNHSPALLQGAQATKAALLEQASKAAVLHFATHAYFAGEDCTPAGLASPPPKTMGEAPSFLGHNPLLLAGIALAGANEREKADGILTALEITALDLRATDLVVLSACDTGLGTPARSQELLGLRWAFAFAGARHLVTSLWSVPDAETAALMTHFYTALWEKGLSVPAALRAAQLEMLRAARAKGDSAPHAWGAFVASGYPD
jgi:CHAT domain-containing protein